MTPNNIFDAETLLAYQQYMYKASTIPKPVLLQLLLEASGVIYGSRGLHIESPTSDYDFAFSYEEHKNLFHTLMNYDIHLNSFTDYFSSAPEAGYYAFFQYEGLDPMTNKKIKVDILFVHNDEDLDVIRSSIQDLQSIPQYMLRDKKFRVDAYNKALQHRGWKELRMPPNTAIRGYRGHPQTTVIRRDRDSRGESLTRGFPSWL